jgi:Ser/Thr protein kinase RdoA (MazF antagonist)
LEQQIKERYSDAVLHEAMSRYGIRDEQIKLLDGFESYMYEFEHEGNAYILRIGHSLRRSENLIHGEVDWINYLERGGASVSPAIRSKNHRLVELIDDAQGGTFLATSFVKAPGNPPKPEQWKSELFVTYGGLIGRMHALSRGYKPANPAWRRPEWDDLGMLDIKRWLPPSESVTYQKFVELGHYLSSLPKNGESYGLIHQDAHAGNFFVDKSGVITLFDFDDCCYSWYMNDIAIVLFYAALGEEDEEAFIRTFMRSFLRGYTQESKIDPRWLEQIPYFLKLREIDLYAIIHRSFDVTNIEGKWVAFFMRDRKEKIENDIPFINFDFSGLSAYLD